jgi:glycosyltransferase involved in cell wall biosynthesis
MKILFLSRWFPYPPDNGSKLRIYNLLRGLAGSHEVTLLSFVDQPQADVNAPQLASLCRDVQTVPWKPFNPNSPRARLGFVSPLPRSVIDTFSEDMKQRIENALATRVFDLVIASEIDMAAYSPYFSHVPAMFEEAEVGVLYEKYARATPAWRRLRHTMTWTKHRHYLARLLPNFRACTVVSERECHILSQAVPDHPLIEVVPNCVDLAAYADVQEAPRPGRLIFTGSFTYYPNYEAMRWFLAAVYPQVQAQVPGAHMFVTGNHAGRPLPPAGAVTLTGFVDDVRPVIARSSVSVVPLHTGGGTRLKILEAMALRTPVVATPKGAEGLEAEADKHLVIAETPDDFARAVIRLLQQPEWRRQITENAYQLVREKYDWATVMPRFLDLVERVAAWEEIPHAISGPVYP